MVKKNGGRIQMSQIRKWSLLIMALVLAAVFFSPVSAANKTNATPPGWVGEFDEWAGPKDMSQHNPVVQTVTPQKMDEKNARMYPGVRIIDPAITFPPVEFIVYTNASPITTVDLQYLNSREKSDSTISHQLSPESGNNTVVTTSPAPVVIATPIYPGMGDSVSDLYGRHPTIKANATIAEFIRECAIGNWYEKKMNEDFVSVHIPPGNSCGKQLVFSVRLWSARDDPTQITDIWIIGANKTWSSSMVTVYPGGGASRFPVQHPAESDRDQDFLIPCAVIAAGLLAVLYRMIRRDRES